MNVLLYFLCLVLMLPVVGFAAFGFLIDSLTQFGFWQVCGVLFSPLYDPFGKGIWIFLLILSLIGLLSAGVLPPARPYGLAAIATIGTVCGIYIMRVYPDPWGSGGLLIFLPGASGVALSLYCLFRPAR